MIVRFATCFAVLVLYASAAPARVAAGKAYYASPQGSGDGASAEGALRVADFWEVARPGDVLLSRPVSCPSRASLSDRHRLESTQPKVPAWRSG